MVHEVDVGDDETVTDAVLRAVAEYEDVDPIDLDETLGDVLDPDALNALFGSDRDVSAPDRRVVTFSFAGCEVTVLGDRTVRIRGDES